MNKFALFTLGVFVGALGLHYINGHFAPDRYTAINAYRNYKNASDVSEPSHSLQPADIDVKTVQLASKPDVYSDKHIDVTSMINALTLNLENLYESVEYKDLTYLMRKDENIAVEVRRIFLNSISYQEKYALVNLLAQDSSKENISLAIDMINNSDSESKKLGLELLRGMNIKESQPELNNVLLDAIYYESNPDLVTDLIYQLSEKELDSSTKIRVIDRFQSLLYSENNILKARAIDGLSILGDQEIIAATVAQHFYNPDEGVRLSAISAAFRLHPNQFSEDIINELNKIINNPAEPENIRNLALSVLSSRQDSL